MQRGAIMADRGKTVGSDVATFWNKILNFLEIKTRENGDKIVKVMKEWQKF